MTGANANPPAMPRQPAASAVMRRSSVTWVDELAGLGAIFAPELNLVGLRRGVDDALREEARLALAMPGFGVLTRVEPAQAHAIYEQVLGGMPRLVAELALWTELLVDLTGCDLVGARLARLDSAMCPRMHVDKVTVRVVCTYWGAGTEFVAEEHVDRQWLGHAARGEADERSGLIKPGGAMLRATPGEVLLLKGEAWPGNEGRGAVHRSPAASAQAPRLVMTLDPL